MNSQNADGTIIKRRTMVSTMKINIRDISAGVLIEWRMGDKNELRRIRHKRKINQSKDVFGSTVNGCFLDSSFCRHFRSSGRGTEWDDINFYFSHDASTKTLHFYAFKKGFFCFFSDSLNLETHQISITIKLKTLKPYAQPSFTVLLDVA